MRASSILAAVGALGGVLLLLTGKLPLSPRGRRGLIIVVIPIVFVCLATASALRIFDL